MSAPAIHVLHLVAADISMGKLAALRALAERSEPGVRQWLFLVGPAAGDALGLPLAAHVRAPIELPWGQKRALRAALARVGADAPRDPAGERCTIVHVWSVRAASWGAAFFGPGRWLLFETEPGEDWERAAGRALVRRDPDRVIAICPTLTARRRQLAEGIPASNGVLMREGIDRGELEQVDVADVRRRLRLDREHTVLVTPPPVSRATGTFVATWAALLLEKVRPDVRLVIPAGGAERARVRRLVRASQHDEAVRFAGRDTSVAELVAIADLVVFLPRRDAPVTGLLWAMAAGRPIVSTAVPAVTEFLSHADNAWLCRPNDPQAAARMMLHALEQADDSRRMAARAGAQVVSMCDRAQALAQYLRLYADLAAGRRPLEGWEPAELALPADADA